MDLRRLEAFLAIVDTGTFAGAADKLDTVQSTVSASIRVLERDLGVQLFDRSGRTATLTSAGVALVLEARELLRRAALARRVVLDAATQLHGELRIGVISSTTPVPLPQILRRFTTDHPRVTLRVLSDAIGSSGLMARLATSELDLAIMGFPRSGTEGRFVAAQLAAGDLVGIVARDDPLAVRETVELADLVDRPWVESPVGQANRGITDEAYAAARLSRTVAVEIGNSAEVPNYVAAGVGVAIVPDFLVRDRSDVRVLRLADASLHWGIALVRLPERTSALVDAFWKAAVDACHRSWRDAGGRDDMPE